MSFQISSHSSVTVMWVGVNTCVAPYASKRRPHDRVWVVDANSTALVTPRLQVPLSQCSCFPQGPRLGKQRQKPISLSGQPSVAAVTHIVSCQPNPCLNGGRCVLQARMPRLVDTASVNACAMCTKQAALTCIAVKNSANINEQQSIGSLEMFR